MSLERFSIYFEDVDLDSPELLSKASSQFSITKEDLINRGMDANEEFSKVYYIAVVTEKIRSFYPIKVIRFLDYQISIQRNPLEWIEAIAKVLDVFKKGFGSWLGLFPLDVIVVDDCKKDLTDKAFTLIENDAGHRSTLRVVSLTPFVQKTEMFLKVEDAMIEEGWLNEFHVYQHNIGSKAGLALIGRAMLNEGYFSKYTELGTEKVGLSHVKAFFEEYFSLKFNTEFTPSYQSRTRGIRSNNKLIDRFFDTSKLR